MLRVEDDFGAVLLPWERTGRRTVHVRAVRAVRREILHCADVGHLGVPGVLGVAFAEATAIAIRAVVGATVAAKVAAAIVAGAISSYFTEVVTMAR
jgi:hypothetical protein